MLNISEEEYAVFKDARHMIGNQLIREGYASMEPLNAPLPEGENPPPSPKKPPKGIGCHRPTKGRRTQNRSSSTMTRWTLC